MEALRGGDASAFTGIYRRYWQKLYAIAYHRLGTRQAAEDVVHEVFASLWKNRERSEIRSLYAYLAAATRYTIIRETARRGHKTQPVPEEAADAPVIDLLFLERMIAEEVNQLPDKCRLVYRYSRETGLTNREIAREMGISEKAVEKHISRALSHLRLHLRHLLHFFL